ncbi:hypothetical protein LEP1GSC013_0371 [Leptospira interrogans serovar Valbuzzi str. Duyster]|nr:WG repeat-containing protein [Leptospira interrogans]EMJ57669.1 hypothetical protein LEP1GSC013_0371 [Leptospira interrogans serovar Valbuzzi str. Duyster]ENO73052.1 hypothetical protein LEP1GSC012_3172 [Leptospira interrogans serovar Valbuzzi str. Valbuzzi]
MIKVYFTLFLVFGFFKSLKAEIHPCTANFKFNRISKNGFNFIDLKSTNPNVSTIAVQFEEADSFVDGFALIKLGGKYGYIDKSGKLVIKPQFGEAYSFSEDLALVKIQGSYEYIDRNGNLVIQTQFEHSVFFRKV